MQGDKRQCKVLAKTLKGRGQMTKKANTYSRAVWGQTGAGQENMINMQCYSLESRANLKVIEYN